MTGSKRQFHRLTGGSFVKSAMSTKQFLFSGCFSLRRETGLHWPFLPSPSSVEFLVSKPFLWELRVGKEDNPRVAG